MVNKVVYITLSINKILKIMHDYFAYFVFYLCLK